MVHPLVDIPDVVLCLPIHDLLDGAPKLAMMCNIIAAIITVILGWLFIFPLGWGLTGAVFAATIALFASGATGLIYYGNLHINCGFILLNGASEVFGSPSLISSVNVALVLPLC
ncbi:MAG: hypothetical protein ACLT38_05360 [Akkermansia sp.]